MELIHSTEKKFDRQTIDRMKREALQLAVQLPSNREEALAVLAFTRELVEGFLSDGGGA